MKTIMSNILFYNVPFYDCCVEAIFDKYDKIATIKEYLYQTTQHNRSEEIDCNSIADLRIYIHEIYHKPIKISGDEFAELVDTRFL